MRRFHYRSHPKVRPAILRVKWLSLLGLASLVVLATPATAVAKGFSFPEVRIEAKIFPDGSMEVVEHRTFSFDGDFSRAYTDLRKGPGWTYSGFEISEGATGYRPATSQDRDPTRTPGTFHVDDEGSNIRLTWYHSSSNEQRSFTIAYTVAGAVKAYTDVSELYWQFIGSGWDAETSVASITISIPEPGATYPDLRVWAHGPLNGTVHPISATAVKAEVTNLPALTFVEVRLVFPRTLTPDALGLPETKLPVILEEEKDLAQGANRRRNLARLGVGLSFLVAMGAIGLSLFLFVRFGKEYRPAVGEYFRELPGDYPPAVMGYLYRYGRSRPEDVTATFLDLARRGYVSIDQVVEERFLSDRTETRLRALNKVSPGLHDFEMDLLHWAIDEAGDGTQVTDEQMAQHAKASSGFTAWFSDWKDKIKGEADAQKWVEPRSVTMQYVNGAVGIAAIGIGILLLKSGIYTGVVDLIAGAGVLGASPTIKRRTIKGATEYEQWDALRRFLLDFSELKDAPIEAVALWEHFLVYAVPLGVAREVIASMRELAPAYERATGHAFSPTWISHSGQTDVAGMTSFSAFESLDNSFSSFVAAATSAQSSESGSGGGFSGGEGGGGSGGGGGGGGGGGAD